MCVCVGGGGVNPTNLKVIKHKYANGLRKLRNKYETLHMDEMVRMSL